MQYWLLTRNLLLVEGLFAPRSNLEMCLNSRGDHRHTAMLPSRESSKEGHPGCHVYSIKWLAHNQIICGGKGVCETPCTHNFLSSLTNDSWKSHPLFIHLCMVSVPSSRAPVLTEWPCSFVGKQGDFAPSYSSGLCLLLASTKPPPVWSSGLSAPLTEGTTHHPSENVKKKEEQKTISHACVLKHPRVKTPTLNV